MRFFNFIKNNLTKNKRNLRTAYREFLDYGHFLKIFQLIENMLPQAQNEEPHQKKRGILATLPIDSGIAPSREEFQHYQSLRLLEPPEDVLEFWKKYNNELPALSKIARKYLSIPHSNALVEKSFSEMNFLINDQRTNLDRKTINELILSKSLLKYRANK